MVLTTRPYRIGSASWFLRIPKDLINLLNITRDTAFEIIFEKSEDGFALIYKAKKGEVKSLIER